MSQRYDVIVIGAGHAGAEAAALASRAGARGRVDILAREHGDHLLGPAPVLQCQTQRRPGVPRGAPAHRVDEDQHGPLLVTDRGVYLGRGSELAGTHVGHLFAHRRDEGGIVRHSTDSSRKKFGRRAVDPSAAQR